MSKIKNKPFFFLLLAIEVFILLKFLISGFDWRLVLLSVVVTALLLYLLTGSKAGKGSKVLLGLAALMTGVFVAGFPVPEYLEPSGAFPVGVDHFEVYDEQRQRTLPTKVWFPLDKAVDVNTLSAAPWVSHQTEFKQAIAQPAKIPSFMFGHLDSFSAGFI